MSVSSSPDQAKKVPFRLRWLIVSQVGLLLVASVAFAYIGWRVKPLLQQQEQLRRDITEQSERLRGLRQQITDKEDVLRQLNSAISKSNDLSLVRESGQIELGPLKGYKVGIHYLDGNKIAEIRAKNLMTALVAAHCPATVALYPKPTAFFDYFGRPAEDDLRYEPDFETAQAQALLSLLRRVDPAHSYALTPVDNRTPNFVSIFLKDGL